MGPGTSMAEPGVVQPHLHLAVARWKLLQGWVAGPCSNLFIANFFLSCKVRTSLIEDLHQTDDTAGIPQYILLSLPPIFLFSRWKCAEYEWITDAVHMAVVMVTVVFPRDATRRRAAQLPDCRLELQCFFGAKCSQLESHDFFFFSSLFLKRFY